MLIRWKSKDKGSSSAQSSTSKKKRKGRDGDEHWQHEKGMREQQNEPADDRRRAMRNRDDPRRHTLDGNMLLYQKQAGLSLQRSLDLEFTPLLGGGAVSSVWMWPDDYMGRTPSGNSIYSYSLAKDRAHMQKSAPLRTYTPTNQGPLFDDDPGIMSEVETASTGFRRGGKQRSSLPVVRTPSKTLERPLGLVFLQYRSETKRALLPNEITSIDTVRALFVRSFPRQLTMQYLEGPNVKIYIHDSSKDMFYELEDVRLHLREIRDRSVLRLFESNEVSAPNALLGGPGVPQPLPKASGTALWDSEQSYFSEPEFDSEYQHQHIHKSKASKVAYYVEAQTLPRGMFSDKNKTADAYMSSPERGSSNKTYEEPYYSQYSVRGKPGPPIIEAQGSVTATPDDQYSMYGVRGIGRIKQTATQMYETPPRPEDLHRIRVEHMERQLANLTGLVQKALTQKPPAVASSTQNIAGTQFRADKSVSFEKSVSFSDDIQGESKTYTPLNSAESKPSKPAIKSSTLPRTSSQERDRTKTPPPSRQLVFAANQFNADLSLAPEVYNNLRGLQKKTRDLRMEVRSIRRLTQTQAIAIREDIKDTFMKIRATLLSSSNNLLGQSDQERKNLTREEEIYKQEVIRLEKDLGDLESSVEGLRGEVINRRSRVNMTAVEDMALVLSRASKTVAELKIRFPRLHQDLRSFLSVDMERLCREEIFLKEEPERLESALRRCKKLTGTLVTLKRLASVQEQRLPMPESSVLEESVRLSETSQESPQSIVGSSIGTVTSNEGSAPENALDALLVELQTFAKPPVGVNEVRPDDSTSDDSSQAIQYTVNTKIPQSQLYPDNNTTNIGLRRLHSYPSGSDTDTSPPQPMRPPSGKPPVPERNSDLLSKVNGKRIPPPPPPRTSSRSPLASPTSPNMPDHQSSDICQNLMNLENYSKEPDMDSSCESFNSDNSQRQQVLEERHQELLKKQKQLQEQYQKLQLLSKNSIPLATDDLIVNRELNFPGKIRPSMCNPAKKNSDESCLDTTNMLSTTNGNIGSDTSNDLNSVSGSIHNISKTTNKVYETDIL